MTPRQETSTALHLTRPPELGQIVLYSPILRNDQPPATVVAIIHHIVDREKGIVDLTLFLDPSPRVEHDVPRERWRHRDGN